MFYKEVELDSESRRFEDVEYSHRKIIHRNEILARALTECFVESEFLQMNDVKKLLAERWSSLTFPSLIELRELILNWDVVPSSDSRFYQFHKPHAEEDFAGFDFYVRTSVKLDKLNKLLSHFGHDSSSCFREFMHHFCGLGENNTDIWRFVNEFEQWRTLKDGYGDDFEGPDPYWAPDSENKRNYDVWKDAFYFYMAGNNDVLLLHRDGAVAWWVMGEAIAVPVADSFEGFITKYVELRASGRAPDSSEGPWETDPWAEYE